MLEFRTDALRNFLDAVHHVFPGSTRGGTLESHTASSRQQPCLKTDGWQGHIQQACPDLSIGCWFNTKHRPGGRRRHRVKPESKTASDVQEISPTVFVDCRSDVADQEFKVGPDLHIVMKTDGAQIIMSIIRRTNGHTNKAGAPGAGIKTMIQSSDEDRFIR